MPRRSYPTISPARRLLLALILVVLAAGLQVIAVQTVAGQIVDDAAMNGFREATGQWSRIAVAALEVVTLPATATIFGLSLLGTGLQRRFTAFLQILIVAGGANISAQIIKHELVDRPLFGGSVVATPNSFPSGHVVLIASVVFALTMAAPRILRPFVGAVFGIWGALAALGTMVAGWHRPSDVVGSALLVSAWALAASGALSMLAARSRAPGAAMHETARDARRGADRTTARGYDR